MWACGCACVLCTCVECSCISWPCPFICPRLKLAASGLPAPPNNLGSPWTSYLAPQLLVTLLTWEEDFQVTHSDVLCWGAPAGFFTLPSTLEQGPPSCSPILSLIGPCPAILGCTKPAEWQVYSDHFSTYVEPGGHQVMVCGGDTLCVQVLISA